MRKSRLPVLKLSSFFAVRVGSVVLLAALAAGVSAAPARLFAQSETQPAQAANGSTSDSAKHEASTQEEQEKAFLENGPIVKWLANTLNVSHKTASNIFVFVNFGILILGIGIPLTRTLPKILRKRSQNLGASIESARKATTEAHARLSAIETQLSGLDAEIAKIRAQVEEESKADEARIKAAIVEESARIVAAAEQEIDSAAAQATRALRHFAADLAIDQAAKQLILTPETDKTLISAFAADVAKGGSN